MPALDSLLKRLGFVRIARYGLVLTPEGRIMSLRPAVLDDGLGGRIVGWPDGDLAAMELQKWEPARPAPKPAVATRLAITPPPIPLPKPAVVVGPIVAVTPVPVVVPAPVLAEPPQVEEDEWEWEIALARARAAADESEQAAASMRRARLDTIPPPAVQPKLAVVTIPPRAETERPVQATPVGVRKPASTMQLPVATIPPAPAVAKPVAVATIPAPRAGTTPPTVIPVPKLPSIKDRQIQIQPVVSSAPARPSRTRLAKGTGPVAPPPPIRAGEDEEKTMPGMPPVAAVVALPSIKRLSR